MATWAFVAAVSWLVVATVGFAMTVILLLGLGLLPLATVLALAAAVVPMLFTRGTVDRSTTAGLLASISAFGVAAYGLFSLGPSAGVLVLAWLGASSMMAARESAGSD